MSSKRWDCKIANPSLPCPENGVRVLCFSDTHGYHDKIPKDWIHPADIALFAGDFTGVGTLKDTLSFKSFFKSLPCKHKIMIAGNHEVTYDTQNRSDIISHYLRNGCDDYSNLINEYSKSGGKHEQNPEKKYDDNAIDFIKQQITNDDEIIYLEEESVNVEGLNIYGTPYSPFFYNWAFPTYPDIEKKNGGLQASRWNKIPDNADIVIVHGPPFNIFDATVYDEHAGCPFLAEKLNKIEPSLCVFGHIHEAYGVKKIKKTFYANVSTLNFRYQIHNKPLLFDLVPF